jgi:hypothetical protein
MNQNASVLEIGSSPQRSGYQISDGNIDLYSIDNSGGDESRITIGNNNKIGFNFFDSLSSTSSSYFFPRADGLANQVLTTDGAGQLSWQNGGGGSALQWYAENATAPATAPVATGIGSIALGDGAEALGDNMFVYGNNAGVGSTGSLGSNFLDTYALPGSAGAGGHLATGNAQLNGVLDNLVSIRTAFTDPSAGALKIVSIFFGGIFSLVLVIVLSFYFAVQDTGIEEFLKLITPAKNEAYVVGLWRRAQRKIGLWMQGQLLSSLIGGVIALLGLLILGVPYALLLAGITAFAMLIPVFGSFISALPAVIIAYATGDITLAFIVAGLYLIINQFEAHLIHPLVVNKVVGIPPLLVILALIVGADLAGFLGVVLAIPFAAALREFLYDIDRGKRARAQAS